MKKSAKKIGVATVATLGSIILHIIAVVSLVGSIPYIIVDKIIGTGRNRLQVDNTFNDDSSKVIYLNDYFVSVLFYFALSFLLLFVATSIVQYPLSPDNLSNCQIIKSFLIRVQLPQRVSNLYKDMYNSGFLYTVILIVIGALIELLDKKLSFVPKIFQDSPYEVLPMEKCAVLLFDLLLLVAVFSFIFGEHSLSFSILSVFVGYFFWVKPDKNDISSKLKELLKVKKILFYFVAMLVIYVIPVLILNVTSLEVSLFLAFLLFFGLFFHLITWENVKFGLSDIRRECKSCWKKAAEETKSYLEYMVQKIRTGISDAISAIIEAINYFGNTIKREYKEFRIRFRKKRRIKEKAISKQDHPKDS